MKNLDTSRNIFAKIIHEWNNYTYGQEWELLINFYKDYKVIFVKIKELDDAKETIAEVKYLLNHIKEKPHLYHIFLYIH